MNILVKIVTIPVTGLLVTLAALVPTDNAHYAPNNVLSTDRNSSLLEVNLDEKRVNITKPSADWKVSIVPLRSQIEKIAETSELEESLAVRKGLTTDVNFYLNFRSVTSDRSENNERAQEQERAKAQEQAHAEWQAQEQDRYRLPETDTYSQTILPRDTVEIDAGANGVHETLILENIGKHANIVSGLNMTTGTIEVSPAQVVTVFVKS